MFRPGQKLLPAALLGCIMAAVLAPLARGQSAEDSTASTWMFGAEIDLNSRYVWRSLVSNDVPVAQPSVWIGRSGWTFTVWSNFVLGREPDRGRFNEVDFQLSGAIELGPVLVEPLVIVYTYPSQVAPSPTTGEVGAVLSLPLGLFTLETSHFLDFWDNGGGYFGTVGCGFEARPAERWTLSAAARVLFCNAHFNSYYVLRDKGAVNSLALEIGLTIKVSEALALRPHLEWNRILDAGVRAAVGRSSVFNIGLAFDFER